MYIGRYVESISVDSNGSSPCPPHSQKQFLKGKLEILIFSSLYIAEMVQFWYLNETRLKHYFSRVFIFLYRVKCSFFFQMFTSEAEGLIKSSVLTSGHRLAPPQLINTDDFYLISLVDTMSIDSQREAAEQHSLTEESLLSDFEDSEETWTPLSPAVVQTFSDGHVTDQVAKKYLIKIREENKLSQRCTRQIAHVTELYIRESLHS